MKFTSTIIIVTERYFDNYQYNFNIYQQNYDTYYYIYESYQVIDGTYHSYY